MVHLTLVRPPHHQHIKHSPCVRKEMKLVSIGTRHLRWSCHVFLEVLNFLKSQLFLFLCPIFFLCSSFIGFWIVNVVGKFLYIWVPLREGHLRDLSPRVFLSLRRTHQHRNLHTCKPLSFYRNGEPIKVGESLPHNALRIFSRTRSLKVQRETKSQLFTAFQGFKIWWHWEEPLILPYTINLIIFIHVHEAKNKLRLLLSHILRCLPIFKHICTSNPQIGGVEYVASKGEENQRNSL